MRRDRALANGAAGSAALLDLRDQPDGIVALRQGTLGQVVVVKQGRELLMVFCPSGVPVTSEVLSGVMSRIDLDDPLTLKGTYTQAMMACLAFSPEPSRVYVMGAGGGRIPMALLDLVEGVKVDGVELDAAVLDISRSLFGVGKNPRLNIACADGRDDLGRRPEGYFEHIYLDCFGVDGRVPLRLSSVEFFTMCRGKLTPGGVACVNLVDTDPRFPAQLDGFLKVFEDVWRFEHKGTHVLFGRRKAQAAHTDLRRKARDLQKRSSLGFDLLSHVSALTRLDIPAVRVLKPLTDSQVGQPGAGAMARPG